MDAREAEARLKFDDAAAHKLKAQAFEHRIDKLDYSIKNAKSQADRDRFLRLKDSSIKTVKKYRQTY